MVYVERGVGDRNILDKFALEFCAIVEKYVKYIIVSGFVAISHGRRRTTEDIDMIIEKISFDKFKDFHEELLRNGFHCLASSISLGAFSNSSLKAILNSIEENHKSNPVNSNFFRVAICSSSISSLTNFTSISGGIRLPCRTYRTLSLLIK